MKNAYLWRFITSSLLTLLTLLSLQAQRVLFEGHVINQKTNSPLTGAVIRLVKLPGGAATTDSTGYFKWNVPKGTDEAVVSFVGYETKRMKLVFDRPVNLVFDLYEEVNQLDEVVVSSQGPDHNVQSLDVGVSKLSISLIKKMPAFMGEVDVIKSLLSLPGVTNVGEGTSDINVRGGNSDQNLILLDEAPIFNPSHLMGLFSVFNPDMVKGISFYRGAIPSQYGGRTSSVLDMSVKSPESNKFKVQGGIGLIANRLQVEGPIIKNKLSFVVGARGSFSDYLFQIANNSQIKGTKANFYDVTSKVEYTPNPKDKIFLTTYFSQDDFKPNGNTVTSSSSAGINSTLSEFNWQTKNATLGWIHNFSNDLALKITAVNSDYSSTISNSEQADSYRLKSSVLFQNLHPQLSLRRGKHQFLFGAEASLNRIQPGQLTPGGAASSINPVTLDVQKSSLLAGYVSDEIQVNRRISFMVGARYSYFTSYGPGTGYHYLSGGPINLATIKDTVRYAQGQVISTYGGFEPRASLKFSLGERSSIKLGYNRMRQYIQRISNTTAAMPTDRWQISNPYLKPQIADQVSMGLFKNFNNNLYEASVEVFGKQLSNVTDYKDGANVLLQNAMEQSVLQGKGEVRGFEVQLKKNKGKLSGWINYTYSQVSYLINGPSPEERINNGNWYPPNFNKPHIVNMVLTYTVNRRVSYSANFTYSTGRPTTYATDKYFVGTTLVPNYVNRNQDKIPDYNRLDLSMTIEPNPDKVKKFNGTWVFSIYNVYARKNAFSVFTNTTYPGGQSYYVNSNTYKLSIFGTIFPSITYNFKF